MISVLREVAPTLTQKDLGIDVCAPSAAYRSTDRSRIASSGNLSEFASASDGTDLAIVIRLSGTETRALKTQNSDKDLWSPH